MPRTKISRAEAQNARQANLAYTRQHVRSFPTGTGPFAAIRRKCLDCTVWHTAEVANCPMTDCALWPYRFGGDPFRKGGRSPTHFGVTVPSE